MLESKSGDVQKYVGSLEFDRRLYAYDIRGSVIHARMLGRQGIIADDDAQTLVRGLEAVREELDRGVFKFKPSDEDIHMAIEARLFEMVGDVAGKLHTGRSRNDQIALDVRMYLRDEIAATRRALKEFRAAILALAESNDSVIMAGYTHLQQAQPVLFPHHMLAYFEMLGRDDERLEDCSRRLDVMPLGSGALAGAPYPLDREWVASQLGFSRVTANSMDAVGDRDFVAEFISCASIMMMHVSRLAEEFILWSSTEFGFITIGDGFTTGSSLMPQKRNPDVAELARGKTGRVYGHLIAILTTLKALPLTYNRDLQEDKVYLFDTVDTVKATLSICADMVASVRLMPERMKGSIQDYVLATDIADYLVRRGVPFREAHAVSARVSAYAREEGKPLADLTLDEYQRFSSRFEDDILGLTVEESVAARTVTGGTAPSRVAAALKEARRSLDLA